MNELGKTITFVVVAAVLAVLAWLAVPQAAEPEVFSDEGELFYPEFDPLEVGAVEVIEYDEQQGTQRPFLVELREGRWVIPSHQSYPADAEQQVGRVAAVFNGVRKGALVAGREADFADLGVEDPLGPSALGAQNTGTRVTLKSRSGQILSDLIVGHRAEGRFGFHYVRQPDSHRTYLCEIDAGSVSTRFADWVETDLLDVTSGAVRTLTFDNYRIDQLEGVLRPGEVLGVRKGEDGTWRPTTFELEDDQELDKAKLDSAAGALANLTLVGVRRKPAGLLEALRAARAGGTVNVQQYARLRELTDIGYYLVSDGRGGLSLASNEGEVRAGAADGVTYTLRFGEVVYGEPDQISAAPDEPLHEQESPPDGEQKAEHRYVFLTADFDESLLGGEPQAPVEPVKPEQEAAPAQEGEEAEAAEAQAEVPETAPAEPEAEAAQENEEPQLDPMEQYERNMAQYERDKERYEEDLEAYREKVEDGRRKAEQLEAKFADWYYVISADAFRKLRVSRDDIVREKPTEVEATPEDEDLDSPLLDLMPRD